MSVSPPSPTARPSPWLWNSTGKYPYVSESSSAHALTRMIDELPNSGSCQTKAYNPSLCDVRHVRDILRHFLPTELAEMILHAAEYYHVRTVRTTAPRVIVDNVSHCAETPILSMTLARPGHAEVLNSVVRVRLVVHGHDQGWSGYPEDQGTTNNSWTWYSIGTADPQTHEQRLATNLHAVRETQKHAFEWEKSSDVVCLLKEEKHVEVWAHTRSVS